MRVAHLQAMHQRQMWLLKVALRLQGNISSKVGMYLCFDLVVDVIAISAH